MTTSNGQLAEALADLAWSQWTELGVRGVTRSHREWSIDPEALVVLTACIAEDDPRLRDESLDWCVNNHRYLSRSRLRNILRRMSTPARTACERYTSTLAAAGVRGWQTTATPWPSALTGKSALAELGRPALVRVRLRAMFGVSARAELLHALAWQSAGWTSSAELAALAGYTKRNVDAELDNLNRAGLVESTLTSNRRMVRLRDRPSFEGFVGAAPARFADWVPLVTLLTDVRGLLRGAGDLDPRVQDVEASGQIERWRHQPAAANWPSPPRPGAGAWRKLEEWAAQLARPTET
jgi:hypothetical protein